jgi:hypothetical protein
MYNVGIYNIIPEVIKGPINDHVSKAAPDNDP